MITIAKEIVNFQNTIHTNIVLMIRTFPFDLKPEYVDEMTVDAKTELKHKAICVWQLLGSFYTPDKLEKYCAMYGITSEQALDFRLVKVSQQK